MSSLKCRFNGLKKLSFGWSRAGIIQQIDVRKRDHKKDLGPDASYAAVASHVGPQIV